MGRTIFNMEKGGTSMNYLTVKEAGEKWGIIGRMATYYCESKRIPGVEKKGNLWLIPAGAEKPKDARKKVKIFLKRFCLNQVLCAEQEMMGWRWTLSKYITNIFLAYINTPYLLAEMRRLQKKLRRKHFLRLYGALTSLLARASSMYGFARLRKTLIFRFIKNARDIFQATIQTCRQH
jgi:hypothetical protein